MRENIVSKSKTKYVVVNYYNQQTRRIIGICPWLLGCLLISLATIFKFEVAYLRTSHSTVSRSFSQSINHSELVNYIHSVNHSELVNHSEPIKINQTLVSQPLPSKSNFLMWNTDDPVVTNWFINKTQTHRNYGQLLENKRIVFIGDSLTRYQYLNLIHYFHTNSWHSSVYPHLEVEGEWSSWKSFHLGSSLRFGCEEICDCYRDNSEIDATKENRHYHNMRLNLSVDAYFWTPERNLNGNIAPKTSDFSKLCSDWHAYSDSFANYASHSNYSYNILDFLNFVVRDLQPDYLIINQGFWSFPRLRDTSDTSYLRQFVSLAKSVAKRVIWKTTTARCDINDAGMDNPWMVTTLNNLGVEIFDAYIFTHDVAKLNSDKFHICWDGVHYFPFVYRELNKMLLDFIL